MRLLTSILFIFTVSFSFSQLTTKGGIAPAELVQDVLVGEGVTVSNVKYTGSAGAIGSFEGSNSSIGFEEGIILTTGTINSGPNGPYGPNNKSNAGIDNNIGGYQPLTSLVGLETFNAAVLEFDFIPQSDTVSFQYIFGSEEYPEWVGNNFNDVFAFFISGPGIDGKQNMAKIPGTNLPVTINNINNGTKNEGPCTNCDYYVNNGTGNNAPYNSDPYYVQYDGFTTPLEAFSPVECGKTYHLTIAISDVGDAIFDSGIFLKANSLSSNQPVSASYNISQNFFEDGKTMAQGCTSTNVRISRHGTETDQPLSVPITLSGTAIEGVDFSEIPKVLNFDANQTVIDFSFDALLNSDLEETVNVVMAFSYINPCGVEMVFEVELFIKPTEKLEVNLENFISDCTNDFIDLTSSVTGGVEPYTYLWSTGETTPDIEVSPTASEVFTLEVTDQCIKEKIVAESEVIVPIFDELKLSVSNDTADNCPYIPFELFVNPIGGAGEFKYTWTDKDGNILGEENTLNVLPSKTTTYYIDVVDKCGESAQEEITITVLSPPLTITVSPDQEICPRDSIQISVQAEGGFGDYYYLWPHSAETTPTVWVNPEITTDYRVIVMDDCQTFDVRDTVKITVIKPEANFEVVTSPLFENLPITFQNLTNNGVYYEWVFGDGNTSSSTHPNNTFNEPGEYLVSLTATDEKGCVDSISRTIIIKNEVYIYVPNAFTPGSSMRYNKTFKASTVNVTSFSIVIYNRWGEIVFQSDDKDFEWDGSYKGGVVKDGTYVWAINYRSLNDDGSHTLNGHVTILK